MQWKITTGSDRATANAQSYTGTEGRPIFVDVVHPGVGPDARVRIIDVTTQRTVADLSCGFTDQGPKRTEFSPVASGSRAYNLIVDPVGATFGAPGVAIVSSASQTPPLIMPEPPAFGTWSINGSSTVANSGVSGGIGTDGSRYVSPYEYANQMLGSRHVLKYHGYAGQFNSGIVPNIPINAAADGALTTVLQLGANDINQTEAAADAAFVTARDTALAELRAGRYPLIHVPHSKKGGSLNAIGIARYAILCEEWAASVGLRVVRTDYAICANSDAIGTNRTGSQYDDLHMSSYGAELAGAEFVASIRDKVRWRIGSVGYVSGTYATELVAHPHMTGTTGTNGTGSSGSVATEFTSVRGAGTATCVASKGSDAEGAYQDLTITFGAASERWDLSCMASAAVLNGRVRAGQKYAIMADVELVSGPAKRISLSIACANQDFSAPTGGSSSWYDAAMPIGRRMIRTRVVDPAIAGAFLNVPSLLISPYAAGTVVVRVRGVSIRESL